MKYILLLLALLEVFSPQAQFSYGSIAITNKKKLKQIQRVPFNEVVVFDNRFDTTNFLVALNFNGVEIDSFSRPASQEIEFYIKGRITPLPKDKRTLYINLKQLRFGNIPGLSGKMFFSADAYIAEEGKLIKVYSLKNEYGIRRSFNHTIASTLDKFLQQLSDRFYREKHTDTSSMKDLDRNVTAGWASYSIFSYDNTKDGVYKTFNDFREDKIDSSVQFNLQFGNDSAYHIAFPKQSIYNTGQSESLYHFWGVCCNGQLYLLLLGKYLLPLNKRGNTFYFDLPKTMPDMRTMIQLGPIYGGLGNGFTPVLSGMDAKGAVIFLGVIVAVAITFVIVESIIKVIKKNNSKTEKSAAKNAVPIFKENNFRHCFLDMDTGDIIYR